jgi:hypothetical protein
MKIGSNKSRPPLGKGSVFQTWTQSLWQIFVTLITFVWFLAVIKVFLLGGRQPSHHGSGHHSTQQIATHHTPEQLVREAPVIDHTRPLTYRQTEEIYSIPKPAGEFPGFQEVKSKSDNVHIPRPNEWELIRDSPQEAAHLRANLDAPIVGAQGRPAVIDSPHVPVSVDPRELQQALAQNEPPNPPIEVPRPPDVIDHSHDSIRLHIDSNKPLVSDVGTNTEGAPKTIVDPANLIPATQLSWPAVRDDFTIPAEEGSDSMPLTNLKVTRFLLPLSSAYLRRSIQVPRFWAPPTEQDLFTTGRKVNEEETIFLMIASYRDFQCRETITSAFKRADHPERLFIGAVDQIVDGDIGCLDIDIPCAVDPTQMICKYRSQIAVYKMDAAFATGPVTARHIGDRMYRGEYFVMQMDAHCLFINHWDTLIINQWRSTGNEMAVLSSYLTDVQGSISSAGDSLRTTRPIMCNSDYEGNMPARYLRHGSQPEEEAIIRTMPMLQPFWAAGFSFSRGHFKVQVPYDGYQPMVFQVTGSFSSVMGHSNYSV